MWWLWLVVGVCGGCLLGWVWRGRSAGRAAAVLEDGLSDAEHRAEQQRARADHLARTVERLEHDLGVATEDVVKLRARLVNESNRTDVQVTLRSAAEGDATAARRDAEAARSELEAERQAHAAVSALVKSGEDAAAELVAANGHLAAQVADRDLLLREIALACRKYIGVNAAKLRPVVVGLIGDQWGQPNATKGPFEGG